MGRNRGCDIRKRAQADLPGIWPLCNHRNPLTGMISAKPAWIVTVIGGKDHQIVGPQL
jgi:hypothetical protein